MASSLLSLSRARIRVHRQISSFLVSKPPGLRAQICFHRQISSFLVREPPASAPRVVPTPLVFVSATKWDQSSSRTGFSVLSKMYSEKGYTCVDTDLDFSSGLSSTDNMRQLESELKSVIRSSFNPFPPVLFARGAACLVTQTYISSNPASAMILVSPPASNSTLPSSLLPTALPEYDFEPKFPILIVATPQEMDSLRSQNRLVKSDSVDKLVVDNVEGQEAFVKIETWMDGIGI